MTEYSTLLNLYQQIVDSHVIAIHNLLIDDKVINLGWEFNEAKNSQPKKPFNVFTMASDFYYRENFHSDIIKAFLDPKENHQEECAFLYAFIDFINNNFGDKISISKMNYQTATVEREQQGRIDILIRSEASMHCIIIENKMYNAGDMQRQLPRYYDFMTNIGYKIDAIVYLPLDINKSPDMSDWSEKDKQQVLPLLCVVPAYQKKGTSLVNGWLIPCTLKTKNIDCVSTLRQYAELIKILSDNKMDNVILNKFYQSLKSDKSLDTALSVRNMLQELPIYMADRLCEKFKAGEGDYKVWKYKPNFCGIYFVVNGNQHKIDIWTSEAGYGVHVFEQNPSNKQMEWAEGMKSLESFTFTGHEYRKTDFTFYDEEEVVECVNAIIVEMRERLFN